MAVQFDRCQYCEWMTAKRGRWARHHELRQHVQEAHPAEFKRMEEAEQKVFAAMGAAYREFGPATKQRYA